MSEITRPLPPAEAAAFIQEHGAEAYLDRYVNADRPLTATEHAERVRERIVEEEKAAELRAKIMAEVEARMAKRAEKADAEPDGEPLEETEGGDE